MGVHSPITTDEDDHDKPGPSSGKKNSRAKPKHNSQAKPKHKKLPIIYADDDHPTTRHIQPDELYNLSTIEEDSPFARPRDDLIDFDG